MSEPFLDAIQFGPHTAFVVQLAEGAPVSSASVVEHVASGRAARFASAAELVDFMAAALRSPAEERTRDA
jgi:hypothetical protein